MAEDRIAAASAERRLVFLFSPVFWSMMRQWLPGAAGELVHSPFQQPLYGIVRLTAGDLRARLGGTDKVRLATAIDRIAFYYAREAAAEGEIGPRRALLQAEARVGSELIKRLRTK